VPLRERVISERAYRASTLSAYTLTVERVIATMRAQLSDPLSLGEMADIACLSPFHFNRVFRTVTDIPPGEFLASLRLHAAKRLLLTTSLSVTDICFELGYTSLGTFTTRFKQLVGLSPLHLRQMAGELADASLQATLASYGRARSLAAVRENSVFDLSGVSGTISAPGGFSGLIFTGLFPRLISQNRPVACTTLAAPGSYHIDPVPDGRYYLLAAALPWSPDPLTYLMPDAGLLVGVSEQLISVRGGRSSAPVHLTLRPLRPSDPPILGVFPPLLALPTSARGASANG
jgi:AraC family transcriptional regulator